ncbi:MAG: hypothetical protein O7G87_23275 [bacterium]|nr:hypothetical protein [bacterium]
MFRAIRFAEDIEPLVRFVEETLPARIVEETVAKLGAGTSAKQMMLALALAAIRSTEMPFVHHGGALHPVAALPAIEQTMGRLQGRMSWVPLAQDVALSNAHIHDVSSGPYVMPEIEPVGEGSVEATREAFEGCLRRNYPGAAEHYFLWLLKNASRKVALESLVRVAVANYRFDEHKLIAVVNSIRLLDSIGWEWAPVILRPVVRYNFMPSVWANAPPADQIETWIEQYGLEAGVAVDGEDEGEKVAMLRQDLLSCSREEQAEVIARTLAGGLSLAGAGEAISLVASEVFIKSKTSNPMGIHAMTGMNALRFVCKAFPGLGARGLLFWAMGPETQAGQDLSPFEELGPTSLGAIREAIEHNDPVRAAACTQAYCQHKGDPTVLLQELGLWAARDDATEMHGMKHHQAMVEEFFTTRSDAAWVHLAAQAKEAALHAGKGTAVYERVLEGLENV